MFLDKIFAKQVNRKIEGVIKADDESGLQNELEEYVLTNEIAKRLESFLDAYNNYSGANGVWISGFFGSGKSHLLKMLAYLLENYKFDVQNALDIFLPKCHDNEILRADLERACAIPSKSILFNIDQKADVISKKEVDALLAVFVKVFDDMCGYCGKLGHIAQLERDLDEEGLYEDFKAHYESIANRPWENGRERALLQAKNIAAAYQKVTDCPVETANGIVNKYRDEYSLSIEDFADKINSYIERQEPNFRLNFFVDEVGQYIADNTKLMTNLQTVAESLATHCKGRAWVIVTAQEDMNAVMGEMDKQQGNDFSKIQARFENRLKLTSTDVSEVIQKRLLLKNNTGIELLEDIHREQVNNFKTLFDFADGSYAFRNFRDRDHFIHSYPFIPYQFDLFQSAIQQLSAHNAFEGKHSSVGERSMLGVFQHVAIEVAQQKVGSLATFDLMFQGIRTALKASVHKAVLSAERDVDNAFAIKVLKALFLVKYVKEFKPTVRNICILMQDSFETKLPQLKIEVEEALALLEQQTYIQRNGDHFEFLTNEEKDIEEEIKQVDIDDGEISKKLEKVLFDTVIRDRKISHPDYKIDYSYTRKLDDRVCGREQELTLHVITPFNPIIDQPSTLISQSMGRNELLVIMPVDSRLMTDILMFKRTDKFVRLRTQNCQQETVKRILIEKGLQNQEREAEIATRVRALLAKSKLYVEGTFQDIAGEDAEKRLLKGFHELINRTYTNLRMLKGIVYQEKQVSAIINDSSDSLFSTDAINMSEPEQEIVSFIQSKKRDGLRTSVSHLLERFEGKPYGWPYAAVLCLLAKVIKRGKVELTKDSNSLEGTDLVRALLNTQTQKQLLLEPQIDFTPAQIRGLKTFYSEYFNEPTESLEAKDIANDCIKAFTDLNLKLQNFLSEKAKYPFLTCLEEIQPKIQALSKKKYNYFLEELSNDKKDDLLDEKEDLLDSLFAFMNGQMKTVFDSASERLKAQKANLSYLESDLSEKMLSILEDKECFMGNKIQKLKQYDDALKKDLETLLKSHVEESKQTVQDLLDRLKSMDEFLALNERQQDDLAKPFATLTQDLEEEKLIPVMRDQLHRFEDEGYNDLISKMCLWATAPAPVAAITSTSKSTTEVQETTAPFVAPKVVESVQARRLKVNFTKAMLSTEADVDSYLVAQKEAMMQAINTGKQIQI